MAQIEEEMWPLPLDHFSHEHPLEFYPDDFHIQPFCSMCARSIPKGKGCYICIRCAFITHLECATFPQHIDYHTLHPHHPLSLKPHHPALLLASSHCHYCDKPFESEEYRYSCDQLCPNSYMHMTCATIPLPSIASNVDFVQFSCHQQPMTLVEHHDHDGGNKTGAKCFACQSFWSAPAYCCTFEKCENFLHKSCTDLRREIRHPFHLAHNSLILQVSKPRSCLSCCGKDCRLIFSCHEAGCDFIFCTKCASLSTTVRCQSHDHFLCLVEKSCCEIRCDACRKSYDQSSKDEPNEVNQTRSFLFRCMDCVFNLHFLCGPLPFTIKYEFHMHPLILSDHSIKEDYLDQYCCDACEEARDHSYRFYCCEECRYATHVHCLFDEILKVIKGGAKDMELQALGESRWDRLRIESMEHLAKELTLKEIKDSLTQQEKAMLIDSVAYFNPSKKVRQTTAYNIHKRLSVIFDPDGTIEDIDKIQQLFSFGYENYYSFKWELKLFTPEEGLLKLDDKYLRQKVEDVDGYMVPKTLAPILKTLLHKYEDLGDMKSLTPAVRSIITTQLCIVIDNMCRIKAEDLTRDDLRNFYFCLQGIEMIAHFKIDENKDSLEDIVVAFLGFEAIRYEEGIYKKLEAELENYKKRNERFKKYKSEMSDCMQFFRNRALEWKHKSLGDELFNV